MYYNEEQGYYGYIPQIIDYIATDMGITYEIIPGTPGSSWVSNLPVEDWPYNVSISDLEMVPTQLSLANGTIAMTGTFYNDKIGAIVAKTSKPLRMFRLFDPFEPILWAAILSSLFLIALVIVLLNLISPGEEFQELTIRERVQCEQILRSMYHMFAAALGGEDYEWVTWPSRILRLAVLFLVLISVSSYTANLAAFFTSPAFKIWGPADMAELKKSVVCVNDPDLAPILRLYASDVVHMEGSPWTVGYAPFIAYCAKRLQSHEIDVWMGYKMELQSYYMSNCQDTQLVDAITVSNSVYGFFGHSSNSNFMAKFGASLAYWKATPTFAALQQDVFKVGLTCDGEEGEEGDTTPLTLESQKGLFLIIGSATSLAVLAAICQAAHRHCFKEEKDGLTANHTMTDGEMIRLIIRQITALRKDLRPPEDPDNQLIEEEKQQLLLLFKEADMDDSGTLDKDEIKRILIALALDQGRDASSVSDRIVEDTMKKVDKDGSGKVDIREFIHLWFEEGTHENGHVQPQGHELISEVQRIHDSMGGHLKELHSKHDTMHGGVDGRMTKLEADIAQIKYMFTQLKPDASARADANEIVGVSQFTKSCQDLQRAVEDLQALQASQHWHTDMAQQASPISRPHGAVPVENRPRPSDNSAVSQMSSTACVDDWHAYHGIAHQVSPKGSPTWAATESNGVNPDPITAEVPQPFAISRMSPAFKNASDLDGTP